MATGRPRGVHEASREPWVATVCPGVGSPPGEPGVGRREAPCTPPRFSPPDPSPTVSRSQWLVSGSTSPRRPLILVGDLSLAHVFSACLPFPVARGRRLPFAAEAWFCKCGSSVCAPGCRADGRRRPLGVRRLPAVWESLGSPEVRFPALEIGITSSREVQGRW